jgi:phosphate-selective porin OprO/OprP
VNLRTRFRCLGALVVATTFFSPASGQEPGFAAERLAVSPKAADAVVPTPEPAVGPPEVIRSPVLAGWDDKNGFFLRSPDDQFLLRITGQVQSDYRFYGNDRDTVDFDNFLIRRARLGIEATVFDHYEFRLLPGFEQGNTRFQDAYLNARWWDEFQFEAGKFKQPFSYEQLIQDRFVPTLERSIFDQLVPARDVGLMVHGYKLFNDRFD